MNLDEMSTKNSAIETNDNAIEITNGSFKWNTKDEKPYLKDINIKLKGICQSVSSKIQIDLSLLFFIKQYKIGGAQPYSREGVDH